MSPEPDNSPPVAQPLFTVGHSNRNIADFVDILRGGGVQLVVDVRTVPRSRANPQYNFDVLPSELAPFQLGYERIAELGGLRGRAHDVAPDVNGYWENRSFHNYADYTLSDAFEAGLDRLLATADRQPTAIMCAEAVWWRCHRRIIADYAIARGRRVVHLMGGGRVQEASMTPGPEAGRQDRLSRACRPKQSSRVRPSGRPAAAPAEAAAVRH